MLIDPEMEKVAVESRKRLVDEFRERYATLRRNVDRIPMDQARTTAEEMNCPLQIAMIALHFHTEGIVQRKEAIRLLTKELSRRAEVGTEVPNLPGNVMDFALSEGRWIQHIYDTFSKNIERKVRQLVNLENTLEDESLTVEKVISVLKRRAEIAETYIMPLLETWVQEHPRSNAYDVLMAFAPAITKWRPATIEGKLEFKRRQTQAFFRKLHHALEPISDSATIDVSVDKILELIERLDVDFSDMELVATSHLLLHMVPRPSSRGDRSSYISKRTSSTRGGKSEPDMEGPVDYLERDVRLTKRRPPDEQKEYLMEKIDRVLRVLRHFGKSSYQALEECIVELNSRLDIGRELEPLLENAKQKLDGVSADKQETIAVNTVFDFLQEGFLSGGDE
ncbi:MAG: hypothetical protein KGY80_10700 [Candidatus Thorarchaeota archaeon]|nr:hypothetical protein [Candidatus Thorarchaeota archaeon]